MQHDVEDRNPGITAQGLRRIDEQLIEEEVGKGARAGIVRAAGGFKRRNRFWMPISRGSGTR